MDHGSGERPLGIPTVKIRVVQMAAVLVLEPIFEADLQPEEYAYRPNHSALDAVEKVHALLRNGHREVVDAEVGLSCSYALRCGEAISIAAKANDHRVVFIVPVP